jgi:hypothetical protein
MEYFNKNILLKIPLRNKNNLHNIDSVAWYVLACVRDWSRSSSFSSGDAIFRTGSTKQQYRQRGKHNTKIDYQIKLPRLENFLFPPQSRIFSSSLCLMLLRFLSARIIHFSGAETCSYSNKIASPPHSITSKDIS